MNKKIIINKGIVSIIIILFIAINVVPSSAIQEPIKKSPPLCFDGNTFYVGGNGPNNYTTIQKAINNASDGDTVFVYVDSSPYYENVVVNKSINLIGEDKNGTLIDGNNSNTITISADYVNVSRFSIYGKWIGIVLEANYTTILDNIIRTDYTCIYTSSTPIEYDYRGTTIKSNIISSDYEIGVFVDLSYCEITHNVIKEYRIIGMDVAGHNNIISKNNIINSQPISSEGLSGDIMLSGDSNIVSNNTLIASNHFSINGIVNYGNNNMITGNVIEEISNVAIYLLGVSNNYISNNSISNCGRGIICSEGSLKNDIFMNNLKNNGLGLLLSRFSLINNINSNNFIDNEKDAKFNRMSFYNTWDNNYWNEPRDNPYLIVGCIGLFIPSWINVDWHPAQEPYDIG